MSRYFLILISLLFLKATSHAGDTLYLQDFLKVIQTNHPLIQKANLFTEFAAAYELKGKGALDPKIQSDYQRKRFDGTDYFTVWQSEVKIPTRLPVDLSLGYENNEGQFLNNDLTVPKNGLVYGTINLSLIRGLLFDSQRYQLQVAELNAIKSQIDRSLLTREIIYQAINVYIEWAKSYYETQISSGFYDLVGLRHLSVVDLYLNGDKPAIDTIESVLNLNTAEKIFLEASDGLISKEQKLSLFIWNEEGLPMQMKEDVVPANIEILLQYLEDISFIDRPSFENDPSIRKLNNKINQLELSNRLQKEQLKPQLDLKYNTILSLGKDEIDPTISFNDYKYGVAFEYPILNRKTKGEIRLNEALIDQNNYDRVQYQESLINKYIELSKRQTKQEEILEVVRRKINNSQRLYEAETLKFQLGESSIFLLNSRERKLLEAKNEQIKSLTSMGKLLNDRYYLKLGQN